MRIISLDLLLGTGRIQRRVNAELALLQSDLAAVKNNTQELREGITHTATSLPALALIGIGGFAIGKMAAKPRRNEANEVKQEEKKSTPAGGLTSILWWQLLMPMAFSWIQARLITPPQDPEAEA
jgi:hypothetical protein